MKAPVLLLALTLAGCGGSSSPTEPNAPPPPQTSASTFHLRDAISGFNTVGGTITIGALTVTVPGGTNGGPGTTQLATGTYTFAAKGLPTGFYQTTTGSFLVQGPPSTNDFTFTLLRAQQ